VGAQDQKGEFGKSLTLTLFSRKQKMKSQQGNRFEESGRNRGGCACVEKLQ